MIINLPDTEFQILRCYGMLEQYQIDVIENNLRILQKIDQYELLLM